VGTIVLVGAIIWKASRLPATTPAGPGGFGDLEIAVPAGAGVASVAIDGERMALTLDGASGAAGEGDPGEIVIVDLRRGEVVGRIRLTSEAPATGAATSP
ncbi:MAG: hypothetical protein ACOC71_00715, partial [Hyphomicrobiales bacterium]